MFILAVSLLTFTFMAFCRCPYPVRLTEVIGHYILTFISLSLGGHSPPLPEGHDDDQGQYGTLQEPVTQTALLWSCTLQINKKPNLSLVLLHFILRLI